MESKNVQLNDSIFISLPGKGTSGLLWQYRIENDGVIDLERIDYEDDVHKIDSTIPVGTSIPEVFKITGQKKGSTKIFFEQRRPWEHGSPPYDTREFEINVD
ncbi:protease inhibitor I42 family protein [Solitalea lacus]|uniref:protease inhibitor I42 family protein n=1 Tax=Solitalea lacus TaxID=2911172 RepID=UPI001EDB9CD5|nr:protease inhibitor I42 family protein [Solitalea lacus]UKJ06412.1 protease inhibitor I42 family protein [Solitalea lacus]